MGEEAIFPLEKALAENTRWDAGDVTPGCLKGADQAALITFDLLDRTNGRKKPSAGKRALTVSTSREPKVQVQRGK